MEVFASSKEVKMKGKTLFLKGILSPKIIEYKKVILRPNGAGDMTQHQKGGDTNPDYENWQCVNEEVADETNLLEGTFVLDDLDNEVGSTDLYHIDNTDEALDKTINSVIIHAVIRCEYTYDPENRYSDYAKICIKIGGNVYYSDLLTTEHSTWEEKSCKWAINPHSGLIWTWNDINNDLQIGTQLFAYGDGSDCTQIYAEIKYV
jgi:hypothetical protein